MVSYFIYLLYYDLFRKYVVFADIKDPSVLEDLSLACESELFVKDNSSQSVGTTCVTPSVSADLVPSGLHNETVTKAHDESSPADDHLLSDVHDVGRHLLSENVATITVGYSKDTDDGDHYCCNTQPSHELTTWLEKTYDTSDYNLARNCEIDKRDDLVVSGLKTEKWTIEMVDKGTTVEDHFDREATGPQFDTSRELQEAGNLLFDFANDCEKNETVELSSDEEREETDKQERKLKVDVGDNVAIKVGESRLEELQKTHGGCTQQMKKVGLLFL